MISEWREVKLEQICEITSSKRIFASEYKATGIPFYRGKEIIEKQKGNPISTELFISESRYEEIKTKFGCPEVGDILLSSVGTLGVPYVVKNEQFYFKDGNLTWLKNFKDLNSKYLYYWILSPECRHQIDTKCIGSTQKALTIETLLRFNVLLPSLPRQETIVAVLSCLDDKIELNNRINKNLEAQAQAIFKSWFVDFEPFQDGEFVDSELEQIPLAWNYGPISSICEYSKRRIAVNSLNLTNYCSTENMLPNKLGVATASGLPNTGQTTAYKKGDTLISNIRPYFKKIFYADMDGGCSTDVLCFVPTYDIYSLYLYQTLYSDTFFDFIIAGSKGTKMPRGDKKQIMQYPVVIPPENVLNKFNSILIPMVKKISNNKRENISLVKLRDTLLPKLMSGEIQIPQEV